MPPVFAWLQKLGNLDEAEMFRVFNMGVGLVVVVSDYYAESIRQQLASQGFETWQLGRIAAGCGESHWA